MKSLHITLRADEDICLQPSYQHQLQSLFYSCWSEEFPEFHDGGDPAGARNLKLFCFGRLEGKYRMETSGIVFSSPVSLEVRSARDELIEVLAAELRKRGNVQLRDQFVSVCELRMEERLVFPGKARIRTRSPVTVHRTLPDGRTQYYSPKDPEWSGRLADNLRAKETAMQMEPSSGFSIKACGQRFRKQVAQFKGTFITGYLGDFMIDTDPGAVAALYYCGLGNRNSQGFGMFDIVEDGGEAD